MKTKKRLFIFILLMTFIFLQITGCASKAMVTVDCTDYEVTIQTTEDCVINLEITLASRKTIKQSQMKITSERPIVISLTELVKDEGFKREPENYKIVSANVTNIRQYTLEDGIAKACIALGTIFISMIVLFGFISRKAYIEGNRKRSW